MRSALLDTGIIVGYLDAGDAAHEESRDALNKFSGNLHTTSAVIFEALYFLGSLPSGALVATDWLRSRRVEIHNCSSYAQLRSAAMMMETYRNVPMDFADASLVLLGETLNITDILTIDRRGFTVFRTPKNKPFRISN